MSLCRKSPSKSLESHPGDVAIVRGASLEAVLHLKLEALLAHAAQQGGVPRQLQRLHTAFDSGIGALPCTLDAIAASPVLFSLIACLT